MKEHLNLNSLSATPGWVENAQNQERLTARVTSPQSREELLSIASKGEPIAGIADDHFEPSVRGNINFDDAAIEAMDFAAVMEQLNFIREQSLQPEGRQMMSLAHGSITPQRVMHLFGTM